MSLKSKTYTIKHVIIGVLAVLSVVVLLGAIIHVLEIKAQRQSLEAIMIARNTIYDYHKDNNAFPENLAECGIEGLKDGWGKPPKYLRDPENVNAYSLYSAGSDGVFDTEDDTEMTGSIE
jgi:hypothetical protein